MDVRLPDGSVIQGVPDDMSRADLTAKLASNGYDVSKLRAPARSVDANGPSPTGSFTENTLAGIGKAFVDTGRGVKQLGAQAGNALGLVSDRTVQDIQADVDEAHRLDAPLMKTGGGIVGNIVGQGAQLVIPGAAIAKAAPIANATAAVARMGTAGRLAAPLLAPAATGAAFAATQPVAGDDTRGGNALMAAIGGAAGQAAGQGFGAIARGASERISPAVAQLAKAAEARGIKLTADQVINSKPLNAVRAALEWVPLSGAAGTRDKQLQSFNRAVSRTVGEDTDNVTMALSSAEKRLGGEFDRVLKNTAVRADDKFLDDLAGVETNAMAELTDAQMGVIRKQLNNLMDKAEGDVIPAQAAYNLKKGLDRLSNSNDTSLAFHAREMRHSLMEAMDRTLGPAGAKDFAKTREQWGNLRELQKLVTNGAEGGISPARLANVKNLNSDDLAEAGRIGAQFLKPRVGDSGTAQRLAVMGGLGAGAYAGGVPPEDVALMIGAGRIGNSVMSSRVARNYLLNGNQTMQKLDPAVNRLLTLIGTAAPQALRE